MLYIYFFILLIFYFYIVSLFLLLQAMLSEEPCTQVFGMLSVFLKDEFLETILIEQKLCANEMPKSICKLPQDCIAAFILSQQNLKAILEVLAFLIITNLMNGNQQPVGLNYIPLIISEIEQLSVCQLVICISFSENCI